MFHMTKFLSHQKEKSQCLYREGAGNFQLWQTVFKETIKHMHVFKKCTYTLPPPVFISLIFSFLMPVIKIWWHFRPITFLNCSPVKNPYLASLCQLRKWFASVFIKIDHRWADTLEQFIEITMIPFRYFVSPLNSISQKIESQHDSICCAQNYSTKMEN